MKRCYLVFLLLFAATAGAQQTEVGGFAGIGGFTTEDVRNNTSWVAGAEACFLCDGRFAIFADYNHYGNTGGKQGTRILHADLFSGGLRIQRPSGRVRPYFDVGISGGSDTSQSEFLRAKRSHGIIGVALGAGAAISISERWYIRPAFRTQLVGPGIHVGASVSASIGYRF